MNLHLVTPLTPFDQPVTSTKFSYNSYNHLLFLLKQIKSPLQLKQVHAQTVKSTSFNHYNNIYLYSRIVHAAVSLSELHYAVLLLRSIDQPNSFIWNTILRAYAWSADKKVLAIKFYDEMLRIGNVPPDKYTFPFVLKACAYLFALGEGKAIHGQLLKLGFDSDIHINNSLIHFYSACEQINLARQTFDKMPHRTVVTWNVIIDGYLRCGDHHTTLQLFRKMQRLLVPDEFTIQSLICSCASLGALSLGIWTHVYLLKLRSKTDVVVEDVLINNSLLDMYSKCGSLRMAIQLFDSMPERDVTSYNNMILGYAMHGFVKEALESFTHMTITEGLKPNSITFLGVLSACNHGGLINEGKRYFNLMKREYKIAPHIEHYGCMVNVLARSGFMKEALELVSNMSLVPDAVIWRSLLDACVKNNEEIEVSEWLANSAIEHEENVSSDVYVLLSRVYATAKKWDHVGIVRGLMGKLGIKKDPGCSSIEMDGVVNEFIAGDTSHSQSKEIYEMLALIELRVQLSGYVPDLSSAIMIEDTNVDGREGSLRVHSERLAIAYGLINRKPGVPIRILKNLRVCSDCHEVTKLISRLFDVEIIVRDRVRFHHFKNGHCSCMGYW